MNRFHLSKRFQAQAIISLLQEDQKFRANLGYLENSRQACSIVRHWFKKRQKKSKSKIKTKRPPPPQTKQEEEEEEEGSRT